MARCFLSSLKTMKLLETLESAESGESESDKRSSNLCDERSYRRNGFIDFLLGFQDILIPGIHAQRDDSGIRADPDFACAVNRDPGIGKSRCGYQDQNDRQENGNQFFHKDYRPFCGKAYFSLSHIISDARETEKFPVGENNRAEA